MTFLIIFGLLKTLFKEKNLLYILSINILYLSNLKKSILGHLKLKISKQALRKQLICKQLSNNVQIKFAELT